MLGAENFFQDISVIIGAAALLSYLALLFRQPIIVAYIACGLIVGPLGLGLVGDLPFVHQVGRIGVTLSLFLAGVVLHPRRLAALFRESALVTLGTCVSSGALALLFARLCGFNATDCIIIGVAFMFSSTILVVKLIPTTTLHHQRMGATCIAVLIAEDLIAVTILLFMSGTASAKGFNIVILVAKAAFLVALALVAEQYVLRRMMAFSDRFHETLYLLAMGWCLGMASFAALLGFSFEIGAFVAGVALARSPLSLFLSERLKPFRDFFLVLFFFTLGAELDLGLIPHLILPGFLLAGGVLLFKPIIRGGIFVAFGEKRDFAVEAGIRMGQASEFSLIIAAFALQSHYVTKPASELIQLATILTMILSSYIVVLKYPTPLGTRQSGLQRD